MFLESGLFCGAEGASDLNFGPLLCSPWGPAAEGGTQWTLLTIPASIKDSNWRITARGKANDCHGRRKPICRNRSREAWSQNVPLRPSMRSLNKADCSVCLLLWKKLWKTESILKYADPHRVVICISRPLAQVGEATGVVHARAQIPKRELILKTRRTRSTCVHPAGWHCFSERY